MKSATYQNWAKREAICQEKWRECRSKKKKKAQETCLNIWFYLCPHPFLKFIYLAEREPASCYHLLAHSPNARKAEAWEFNPGLPHRRQTPSDLNHHSCLFQSVIGETWNLEPGLEIEYHFDVGHRYFNDEAKHQVSLPIFTWTYLSKK